MYTAEHLRESIERPGRRGLPLPERLHAESTIERGSIDVPAVSCHDLAPRWRMAHRCRSFPLLRAQIFVGSRCRFGHRELSVIKHKQSYST